MCNDIRTDGKVVGKKVSIPFISGQCVIDDDKNGKLHQMFQSPLYRVNV